MEPSEMNGQLGEVLSGETVCATNKGLCSASPENAVLCRLCAEACSDESPLFLFEKILDGTVANVQQTLVDESSSVKEPKMDSSDLMVLIDKTLPIKVSQSDPLPKQVCSRCVERLKESYSFVLSVINAESRLRSMVDSEFFCASEFSCKDEGRSEQLPQETGLMSGLVRVTPPAGPKYCCPLCPGGVVRPSNQPPIPLVKKLVVPEKASWHKESNTKNNVAWDGTMIKLEREEDEPTAEEMERSYRDLLDVRDWRTALTERQSWPRSQPSGRRGYKGRPRGRPRGRTKMIPRGRRGTKRLTHTTVERILELSRHDSSSKPDVVRVRSGSDRLHADALTQCLLCEGWLPGLAACLQHALTNHTDCGVFLCPRCQQDDFPGDFELIQHFQESHCPDLELCDASDDDSVEPRKKSTAVMGSCDIYSDIPQTPSVHSEDTNLVRPQSRLSSTTDNFGPDLAEKQNGGTNEDISQELTVDSLLEVKESKDLKDLPNAESSPGATAQNGGSFNTDSAIIPSITSHSDEPRFSEESIVEPAESNNDTEDMEDDRGDTDEQDTKSSSKFDHYRKDSEDPEGGGGNSSSGNSNNLVDDNSNSFENGDTSSQNTQPETKSDHNGGVSGTECRSSLLFKSLLLTRCLPKEKSTLQQKHKFVSKSTANIGRKPKRKRLCRSLFNLISQRSTKGAVPSFSRRSHVSLKSTIAKAKIAKGVFPTILTNRNTRLPNKQYTTKIGCLNAILCSAAGQQNVEM